MAIPTSAKGQNEVAPNKMTGVRSSRSYPKPADDEPTQDGLMNTKDRFTGRPAPAEPHNDKSWEK
jgi:hypothetical protein